MSSGRHAFQTCICSLIGFNSYFVLCCFGNNPLYMDFKPITILFCSVLFCSMGCIEWLKVISIEYILMLYKCSIIHQMVE